MCVLRPCVLPPTRPPGTHLAQVQDALIVEEVIVPLPVERLPHQVLGLERLEHVHDVQVGHVEHVVLGQRHVLLDADDALLEQVGHHRHAVGPGGGEGGVRGGHLQGAVLPRASIEKGRACAVVRRSGGACTVHPPAGSPPPVCTARVALCVCPVHGVCGGAPKNTRPLGACVFAHVRVFERTGGARVCV